MATRLQRLRRPIFIVVVLLLLALVLEIGVYLGQHAAFAGMGAAPEAYVAMQSELLAAQNALKSQEEELAIRRTRQEVDRHALELVRKEMAGQREEIAGLEEALGFYRSLISPGDIAPGLSLRGVELMAGDRPGRYFYRIVVQQEARKHEQLKGELEVVISGVRAGEQVQYSLAELSEEFRGDGAALQFRYFQSSEGMMILPEGFEPGSVSVEARTLKPHKYNIREEYPWQLKERFTHVGK